MSGAIWEPQPAYGIEIPDITTVVEPASIIIRDIEFPAVAFAYTQQTASNTWTINHNLNFNPNVTVVDSAGTNVEGEVRYVNSNQLTISFQSAFSGYAYLS
jgi:hypothetical protein